MKNKRLFVTPSPHLYHKDSVPKIMWIVFISLLPAGIWGVYYFGIPALKIILTCVIASLFTEIIFNLLRKHPITIGDGSAAVTGLLIAFTLPPYVPLYIPITASIFAIGVVKHLFGGLGYNVLNPALCGRVFVMFAWIGPMTDSKSFIPMLNESFFYQASRETLDAISTATPLNLMKGMAHGQMPQMPTDLDLFLGKVGGSIGEVSVLFLLIGAIWLFKRRYITWHTPFAFIGSTFILTSLYALSREIIIAPEFGAFHNALIYGYLHLLSGGLILGAFYMATDMVTSPLTLKGQFVIGLGCGILTAVIRIFGGYPEGVMFAILLMQLVVPLIDRISRPKIYGWGNSNEK